ncbi:MAG: matrixin family metalloprotease [Candidatus Aenigmatarchaeota archaeon]
MKVQNYFGLGILLVSLLLVSVNFSVSVEAFSQKKFNEPLEKVTFIHYKDGKVKLDVNNPKAKVTTCYKLMGVKWKKFPINIMINPEVNVNAILESTKEWDKYTSTTLFGSYSIDSSANFDESPDGKNEYSYGNYPQSGVIAITNIWYTRTTKEIVEFDVLFDSDFIWGDATTNPNVMDWQNIATHETGHGLGLSDVYQSACSEVTMYGYSWEGDIGKRTLEQADIIGLQKLYGA